MNYWEEKFILKNGVIFIILLLFIFVWSGCSAGESALSETEKLVPEPEENPAAEDSYSVFVKGTRLSLYEEKGAVLEKLKEGEISYFVKGTELSLYEEKGTVLEKLKEGEISYTGSENPTLEDDSLYLYFDENDKCQRMDFMTSTPQLGLGVHIGNSVHKMKEVYGDSYEKMIVAMKGVYVFYRYYIDDFILEFGAGPFNLSVIHKIRIYNRKLYPILYQTDVIWEEPKGLSEFYYTY